MDGSAPLPPSICPTGLYQPPPSLTFAGKPRPFRRNDASCLSRRLRVGFLALAAIACVASLVLAQMGATMIAIDKMTIGDFPADFEFARTGQGGSARWLVVADVTAASGRAIEQMSNDATDYRFPLAIYQGATVKNADVTVRFKAVSGRVDQAAGIAVRLLDPDNYYVVRANALEDNVRFYRMLKGRREQLAGANIKVATNEWHTLGLRAEGEQFTVMFNGRTLYSATDKTFSDAGKIALWTKADSVTRFDQIEIRALP